MIVLARVLLGTPSAAPIGLVLLCVLTGCAPQSSAPSSVSLAAVPPAPPSVLVVHHSADESTATCFAQTRQVLAYAKTPYDTVDLARATALPELTSYRAVVVATEQLGALSAPDARRLLQFVETGGGLAVLIRGWHPLLGPALGHPTAFDPAYALLSNEQLRFHGHLMSGAEGLTLDSLYLSILDFEGAGSRLSPSATILATAPISGRPLAWLMSYGRGRTLFWNGAQLASKSFRGALVQSIAAVQPYAVRPLANWGAVYLDDFPSPGVSTKVEPIASELGLSPAEFYATRWYPDMRRLADEFGLRYTSTVVFSYDGSVTPPYRFHEWLNGRVAIDGAVVYYSPWIAQQDGRVSEMALHGYNHQPLVRANWPSPAHMRQALTAARNRWAIDDIGPMPTTYVPPMNQVDSTGLQALLDAFPSLTTVAGLYDGSFALGQNREFGPEPWTDALYALPRNTSGYVLSDLLRLSMVSRLEVLGTWGHFVHPDDVYPNADRETIMRELGIPIPDEGFRWYGEPAQNGLYYQFREWLTFARTEYPWLRYVTAREATSLMKTYDTLTWREHRTADTIEIHTSQAPSFFAVYTPSRTTLSGVTGGTLLHRTETALLTKFVIRAAAPLVTLQLSSAHDSSHDPSL